MGQALEEKVEVLDLNEAQTTNRSRAVDQATAISTVASQHIKEISEQIAGLVITDNPGYEQAGALLKTVKDSWTRLEAKRKEIVKPINESKERVQALFKPDLDEYKKAEVQIKRAISSYQTEQDRIRKEAEDKARKEAEATEKKRKEELEAQAKKWEEKGNAEKAEERREQATEVHVPAVAKYTPPPKAAGISTRKIWKARPAGGANMYDLTKIPPEYLLINESALNRVAQATKGAIRIPGVELYESSGIAVRN